VADRLKWINRKFAFDFPAEIYPELLERLRGTPARLAERVGSLPSGLLVRRDGDSWSIQEHAGHLADVEELFDGRIDDYAAGLPTLRPAEMTGRKTFAANHNEKEIATVLAEFQTVRAGYLARLEGLAGETFARSAHHPRLDRPMRLCDMLFFHAEHDDYHLARITELRRKFGEK